jgi:hypothetical protein
MRCCRTLGLLAGPCLVAIVVAVGTTSFAGPLPPDIAAMAAMHPGAPMVVLSPNAAGGISAPAFSSGAPAGGPAQLAGPPQYDVYFHPTETDILNGNYVYGDISIWILVIGVGRWRVTGDGLNLQPTGAYTVPPSRVQVSDAGQNAGVWISIPGSFTSTSTHWAELKFRIKILIQDPYGSYLENVAVEGYQIGRLLIDVPPIFVWSLDDNSLPLGTTVGDLVGWRYSPERTLTVKSNMLFNMSIPGGQGPDLSLIAPPHGQIETALRFQQELGDGSPWETWNDLGGDANGHGTPDQWTTITKDSDPTWPGIIHPSPVPELGVHPIGVTAAGYRNGIWDDVGDYSAAVYLDLMAQP